MTATQFRNFTVVLGTLLILVECSGVVGLSTTAWVRPKRQHSILSAVARDLELRTPSSLPGPSDRSHSPLGQQRDQKPVVAAAEASTAEVKSAIVKTSVAVSAAVLFGVFLMASRGISTGYEFFAGSYLVEQTLSIDNLFVFIMLFDYFRVPLELQNRVLSWGVTGALFLRGLMVAFGVAAIQRFKAAILVFAVILLASSYKLLTETGVERDDVAENFAMKLAIRLFPTTTPEFHGEKFFVTSEIGQRMATPLLLCLVCVELSDFVFAIDSIPAVLGVSKDPLVVYASNIFATLALRSLYTLIAKAVTELRYLKPAVAMVLGFVASKMIAEYFHIVLLGTGASLSIVGSLLGLGILASIRDNSVQLRRRHASEDQVPSIPVSIPLWTNMTLTT